MWDVGGGSVDPRPVRIQPSARGEFVPIQELFEAHSPDPRFLPASTIEIWPLTLAGEESLYAHCMHWLDRRERERAARFYRPQDRERYVLAHGGLRFILSLYLGLAPGDIALSQTSAGKPVLADLRKDGRSLTFNLSHAHGNAMIAIAQGKEVGVDLELIREDVEVLKLADRFFSVREQEHLRSTLAAARSAEFFHYWVAKEAVLKAEGVGLASLQDCEIDWLSGSDLEGVRVRIGGRSHLPWVVRMLDCGSGWAAAVAAQGPDWTINLCRR